MKNVKEQVKNLASKYSLIKNVEINDDTTFKNDLGFDSIGFVTFIIELEQMFNIEIDDEFLSIINTTNFNQLCKHILSKL
ncbi:MAG: acyl carrier protein [Saccharofermentanales bacterium]